MVHGQQHVECSRLIFLCRKTSCGQDLDQCVVCDGSESLWNVFLGRHMMGLAGLDGLPLYAHPGARIMSLLQFFRVILDTTQKIVTAFRMPNVFNADVDTLLEEAIANALVEDNTNRRLCNIVDDTSATVVKFVWHTLLDSSIGLHIDDVTNFISLQVCRQLDGTMLTEFP